MHRLFVAIDPPGDIKTVLLATMGGIAGVRWQTEAQLHLTLRFIGEVDRHQANDIVAALRTLHHPPFDIAVSGAGTFDTRGQIHTLWAGLTPKHALTALYGKVNRLLREVGIPADPRAYTPHITLARLNRSTGPLDEFLQRHAGLTTAPFRVTEIKLYESQLTAEGANYRIVEQFRIS